MPQYGAGLLIDRRLEIVALAGPMTMAESVYLRNHCQELSIHN